MSRLVSVLVVAGIIVAAVLTALGLFSKWWPALDIVNNGLPVLVGGTLLVLCLSLLARDWRLAMAIALLAALNIGLLVSALSGEAPAAAPDSQRFLRVVTLNVWRQNDRIDDVAKFIAETAPDVVVMQEMTVPHWSVLRQSLAAAYPFAVGESGLVMMSKHRIVADGRLDRAGYPPWISLMLRWAQIEIDGTSFELVGVHLARPFYPELQAEDVATLTQFLRGRSLPLIVAGDFNMTPWTEKFLQIKKATGLKRYNNFYPTWPMRLRNVLVPPLIAIDNVLASPSFSKIAVRPGPPVGSDHRPIIADIALVKTAPVSAR